MLSTLQPRQLYPERRVSAILWIMDISGQETLWALWRKEKFLPFPEIQCPLGRFTGRRLLSTMSELSRLQQNRKLIWKWIFEAIACKDVNWTEGDSSYVVIGSLRHHSHFFRIFSKRGTLNELGATISSFPSFFPFFLPSFLPTAIIAYHQQRSSSLQRRHFNFWASRERKCLPNSIVNMV